MKTKLQSCLAALAAGATLWSAAQKPALADPPANSGSWTLQFSDDFNTLDLSTWHNGFPAFDGGYHDSPYRFQGYMPDGDPYANPPTLNTGKNVWTSNGNLVIQSRKEANRGGGPYTTGYINSATRKTFLYGYFEIRAKFQSSAGYDPDFFLFTNDGSWPPEIDIVEVPGRSNGNEAQFNVHWRTDGKTTGFGDDNSAPFSVGTDPNNYHTYAALWDPKKVIFYFDGKEAGRIVGHSPNVQMMMNLAAELQKDSGGFYGDPANGVFPSTQYVDYVKVWSHDGDPNVPQLDQTNIYQSGGTIAARGDNPPNETKDKAFDGNVYTKWLDFGANTSRSSWISYTLPSGQKKVVTRVALTAPAASHERDPSAITVYGINDDGSWAKLASFTGLTFSDYQRRLYDFANTTPYKGYVLGIDTVNNPSTANSTQLAEVEFLQLGNGVGANLVANPGFEADGKATQTPQGWSTWPGSNGTDANASYTENLGVAHGGSYHLAHYKGAAYEVYTNQTITGLANGNYTLTAWVESSGGQTSAFMSAKNYATNATELKADIKGLGSTGASASNWKQITLSNIPVSNGQCTIGFYSKGNAGNWIRVDDVSLTKQ